MVASTFVIKYPETTNQLFTDSLSPSVTNVTVNSVGLTLNDASGQTVIAASQITTPLIQPEQILDSTGAAGTAGQVVGSDASGNTVWVSITEVQSIQAVLSNGTDANYQGISNLASLEIHNPAVAGDVSVVIDPSQVIINRLDSTNSIASATLNEKSLAINVTGSNDAASKISITTTDSNHDLPSTSILNSNSLTISASNSNTNIPNIKVSNALDASGNTGYFSAMSAEHGDGDKGVVVAGYYDNVTPANGYRISAGVNDAISSTSPSITALNGANAVIPLKLGNTVSIVGSDGGSVSLTEGNGVLSISTPLDSTSGRTLVPYYLPIISADQSQTFYIQLWQ